MYEHFILDKGNISNLRKKEVEEIEQSLGKVKLLNAVYQIKFQ